MLEWGSKQGFSYSIYSVAQKGICGEKFWSRKKLVGSTFLFKVVICYHCCKNTTHYSTIPPTPTGDHYTTIPPPCQPKPLPTSWSISFTEKKAPPKESKFWSTTKNLIASADYIHGDRAFGSSRC